MACQCASKRAAAEVDKAYAMKGYGTGAVRHQDPSKLDYEGFLSPIVLEEYARYMNTHRVQADGQIRDSDNWQKGMARKDYMKSLLRHAWQAWKLHRGWNVEEEIIGGVKRKPTMLECLNGILFNTFGYMHEVLIGRDVGAPAPATEKENPAKEAGPKYTVKALQDYYKNHPHYNENAKLEQEKAIQKDRIPSRPDAWTPMPAPSRIYERRFFVGDRPQLTEDISHSQRTGEEAV